MPDVRVDIFAGVVMERIFHKVGDKVNLETDILAKYVERLVESRGWEKESV